MKKNWIGIVIIFLLALNAAFLATLIIQKKQAIKFVDKPVIDQNKSKQEGGADRKHNFSFEEQLALDLDLNESQVDQLKEMSEEFHGRKRQLGGEIGEVKSEYIKQIANKNPDQEYLEELADSLGRIFARKMLLDYTHYQNIKSICSPEQANKLDSLGKLHMNRYEKRGHERRQNAPGN